MNLEKIYSKCEEVGDCLEWQGYVTKHGEPVTSEKKIRRLVWEQTQGPIPDGMVVTYGDKCNSRCICHLKLATKRQIARRTGKQGGFSSPERAAAITLGRRKNTKYSQELVNQIRYSALDHAAAAKEFGVSRSYVYKVRNNETRRDLANPFAGLFTSLAANDSTRRRA